MTWTPLHSHTHYSLLDGLSKPSQVASRCADLGYTSCAVTDHGTIAGAVAFTKACQNKNIKPEELQFDNNERTSEKLI